MSNFYALVMAGGKGTRFWPESTSKRPKQYLKLISTNTLLEETLIRFGDLIPKDRRFIISTEEQRDLVLLSSKNLAHTQAGIYEPEGRNTGPCILLALAKLESMGVKDQDIVAIVPSDHIILNVEGLKKTLSNAFQVAKSHQAIVTIGILPHFPNTGFGYIKRGEEIGTSQIYKVDQFKEKPSYELAAEYLKSGLFFWNAGMFVASVQALKNNFREFAPDMFEHYSDLLKFINDENKVKEIYKKLPAKSIDYAVMEKAKNVYVAKADFDWNDLGSWDAMESILEKKQENTFISSNQSFLKESKGNIILAPEKFVALIGVNNFIIVNNKKTLMIVDKSQAQNVKEIVEFLQKSPDPKIREDLL